MNAGFVKLRRGIIDHVRDGNLNTSEFAVFQLLVLLADSSTGSQTINAVVLRSYLQDMTRDTAQRTLVSLEKKGFIFRLRPASSRRAYRYFVNKYEATTGPHRLRRTDLSQVFISKDIKDIRWVDCATEISTVIQTVIPNSNKKEEIQNSSSDLRPLASGRENGTLVVDQSVIHEKDSSATNTAALPKDTGAATDSLCLVPPPPSARARAKRPKQANDTDPRHEQFKAALERNWTANNPGDPFLWDASEGVALKTLLSAGGFSLERFEFCLASRSSSENPGANRGQRPRKFLADILTYSRGPLDQYGRLKSSHVTVPSSTAGRKSIAQQNTEYLQNKEALLRAEGGAKVGHA